MGGAQAMRKFRVAVSRDAVVMALELIAPRVGLEFLRHVDELGVPTIHRYDPRRTMTWNLRHIRRPGVITAGTTPGFPVHRLARKFAPSLARTFRAQPCPYISGPDTSQTSSAPAHTTGPQHPLAKEATNGQKEQDESVRTDVYAERRTWPEP